MLPDNGSGDDISRVTCSTTTVAVIMPNAQGIRTNLWQAYLTTVSAVETLTGYHFFTNLPQPIQNCIKAGTNGVNPKNDQTITFAPIGDQPFGVDVALQATASSGLAVTLAVTAGPATILNGTTLHVTGVGTVTVHATQAGDVNYNARHLRWATQSFNVTPGSQTITFGAPAPTPTFGDPAFQVSATGGPSGNPVTFAVSGGCTVTSQPGVATITIVSAGVCTVTASQAGNADYNAAPPVSEAIVIGKATPSFTGLASPTIEAGTATTTLGGSLVFGGLIPTGSIAITLNGVTQAAVIQANGSFTSPFATGPLTPTATPYAIGYAYAGDSDFNSAAGAASLTVVATTAPTLTLPSNITTEATGPLTVVAFTVTASDLDDGVRPVSCTPPSGSGFAVGTTTVTCTASDTHGNSASGSFTVTISDHTAPVITVPANITATATTPSSCWAVTFAATAADAADGVRPVVCAPASGATFPIGTTTVSCTASDTHGNSASRSFTVTVTTALVPGTMTGDAAVTSGSTTTTIQFTVLEGARGADAGFLIYDARSRQSGKTQENIFISALVTSVSLLGTPGVSPGKQPASGVDTVSFSTSACRTRHAGLQVHSDGGRRGRTGSWPRYVRDHDLRLDRPHRRDAERDDHERQHPVAAGVLAAEPLPPHGVQPGVSRCTHVRRSHATLVHALLHRRPRDRDRISAHRTSPRRRHAADSQTSPDLRQPDDDPARGH